MTQVFVMYDVSTDALRRQVRSLCRRFGGWQQYSVFEMELTRQQRLEFQERCQSLIDEAEVAAEVRIITAQDDTTIGARYGSTDNNEPRDEDDTDDPANIV